MASVWYFFLIFSIVELSLSISLSSSVFFNTWCKQNGKNYSSAEEKLFRFLVYKDNLEFVTKHNSKRSSTYTLALNPFADLTHDEFKAVYLSLDKEPRDVADSNPQSSMSLPRSSVVEGGSWTFLAAPDAIEELKQADPSSPVRAVICAGERVFQFYAKGILGGSCSTSVDHVVLVEGYGSKYGIDYWIVKNSWGTNWGMDGYMDLYRASDDMGDFGLSMLALRPTKTIKNLTQSSPTDIKCNNLDYCSDTDVCCCNKHLIGVCFLWTCCPPDHPKCTIINSTEWCLL